MQLNVPKDPLMVLSSTKPIVESLRYITIHKDNLSQISASIAERLKKGLDITEVHFGETTNLVDTVQLIFFEDVVNFCFWAEKDKAKWQVEWPKGTITSGGWYGLTKCFQRAIVEKIPILDAGYVSQLSLAQVKNLFRGVNNISIPLIEKRLENLRQAGRVLQQKYNGQFINALEASNFDAIELVKIIYEDFSSFADISLWKGKKIYFLKRAQICAGDLSYLKQEYKNISIKNIELLTGFADYKIPQMLRKFGLIEYRPNLAGKIDNYVLIPAGSREEIEIRAVAIWCIELIKQQLKKYSASEIDNALWLLSQDQTNIKPYHRTYTIYY